MKTLDEICIEKGADKGSTHPVKGHGFARHYDRLFAPLRMDRLNLMEIGVGGGESIRAWLDYFPSASIYGVDIVANTNPWNTPDAKTHDRYRFLQHDQTDKTGWACVCANWGTEFDIIVDDGGHFTDGIIITFNCMWQMINPGGFYCIEDLGSWFTPGSVHIKPGFPDRAWLHAFVDRLMTGPLDLDSAFFAEELVILKKKP